MDNQPHGDHPRSEKKPDCGSRVGFSEQTSRGLGRASRENEKPGVKAGPSRLSTGACAVSAPTAGAWGADARCGRSRGRTERGALVVQRGKRCVQVVSGRSGGPGLRAEARLTGNIARTRSAGARAETLNG